MKGLLYRKNIRKDFLKKGKIMEKEKKIGFLKFLPVAAVAFLTAVRFYLGIKTPVYLQADATMDDFLYIQYAAHILEGKWLGDFSALVLLKTAAPALLLAMNYVLGISYPVFLAIGYILAASLFSLAMCRLSGNRKLAVALYLFLLYSPGMFHEENVQKVYRGGYIVIFALLALGSVIGQFAARNRDCKREAFLWSLLGCVSLPVFYYLKEDSIWILPFVWVGTALTMAGLWRGRHTRKGFRFAAAMAPLLALGCVTVGYKMLNYHYYGEYAITDRSGTYCKEVMSDLLQVDDGKGYRDLGVWVTRNMVHTAAKHSKTLEGLMPYVEQSWNAWCGENEAPGDFYIWAFRGAMELSGAYGSGGAYVDSCYRKIHEELEQAFESGALKRWEGRVYMSSTARGFTAEELADYYKGRFPGALKMLASYQENATTSQEARGLSDNLALMSNITMTHFRWGGTNGNYYKGDELIVKIENKIVRLYQITGLTFFWAGLAGCGVLLLQVLAKLVRNEKTGRQGDTLLVVLGLAGSCLLLIAAVTWFCNFLSDRKVYDYLCAAIPLMETVKAVGVYYLVCAAGRFWKKRRLIQK